MKKLVCEHCKQPFDKHTVEPRVLRWLCPPLARESRIPKSKSS